jgi:hypothetical protein
MTKTFEDSPHASQVCGRGAFVATEWLWRTDATGRSGLNSHRREALWAGSWHNRVTRAAGLWGSAKNADICEARWQRKLLR